MKTTPRYHHNVTEALARLRVEFWSAVFVLIVALIAADAFGG